MISKYLQTHTTLLTAIIRRKSFVGLQLVTRMPTAMCSLYRHSLEDQLCKRLASAYSFPMLNDSDTSLMQCHTGRVASIHRMHMSLCISTLTVATLRAAAYLSITQLDQVSFMEQFCIVQDLIYTILHQQENFCVLWVLSKPPVSLETTDVKLYYTYS